MDPDYKTERYNMLPSDKSPGAPDTRTRSSAETADEEFSHQIVAASPVGITIYDSDGHCIMANAAAAGILGATQESLLAQNFHALRSWLKLNTAILELIDFGCLFRFSNLAWHYAASG